VSYLAAIIIVAMLTGNLDFVRELNEDLTEEQ